MIHNRRLSTESGRQMVLRLFLFCAFWLALHQVFFILNVSTGSDHNTIIREAPQPRILVVYSGPTDYTLDQNGKATLYRLNFEYFIKNGIQCQTQDTALVVTTEVEPYYRQQIDELNLECKKNYGTFVKLILRNNTCYDMESVRTVLNDPIIAANVTYDYFLYANCGVTGPAKEIAKNWTSYFISKLTDRIKMTGLTAECSNVVHIQSMVYAVDRVGLSLIQSAPFDCNQDERYKSLKVHSHRVGHIVNGYERKMGQLIMENGYGIEAFLRPKQYFERDNCTDRDMWLTKRLLEHFDGQMPRLQDTMFFKTSRVLTPEIAKEIGYTGKLNWNW